MTSGSDRYSNTANGKRDRTRRRTDRSSDLFRLTIRETRVETEHQRTRPASTVSKTTMEARRNREIGLPAYGKRRMGTWVPAVVGACVRKRVVMDQFAEAKVEVARRTFDNCHSRPFSPDRNERKIKTRNLCGRTMGMLCGIREVSSRQGVGARRRAYTIESGVIGRSTCSNSGIGIYIYVYLRSLSPHAIGTCTYVYMRVPEKPVLTLACTKLETERKQSNADRHASCG